jgi:hypothetical protein
MKPNMGTLDRAVRIFFVAAVVVLYLTGTLTGIAALILGAIAAISVITTVAGFCPLYVPLKISTRRDQQESKTS